MKSTTLRLRRWRQGPESRNGFGPRWQWAHHGGAKVMRARSAGEAPLHDGADLVGTQAVSFLNRSGRGAIEPKLERGENDVVTPLATLSAVNEEISTLMKPDFVGSIIFGGDEGSLTGQDVQTLEKAIPRIRRLDNPSYNDFFSTDRVSCHVGSQIEGSLLCAAQRKGLEKKIAEWNALPDNFKPEADATNISFPHTIQHGKYTVINVGYLEVSPNIGRGTLNESSFVASLANHMVRGSNPSPARCDRTKLRLCAQNPLDRLKLQTAPWVDPHRLSSLLVMACMKEICPEKDAGPEDRLRKVTRPKVRKGAKTFLKVRYVQSTELEDFEKCDIAEGDIFTIEPQAVAAFSAPGHVKVRMATAPDKCRGTMETVIGKQMFVWAPHVEVVVK